MDKLKAITIFVEIADHGSLSAAARSLGVVNSVISKNLNELETWLNKKLVFRSTRNMRLTQDGLNYLEECRVILNNIEKLENKVNQDIGIIQGQIKITAPVFLGQFLLAPMMASIHHTFPLIKIDIVLSDDFKNLVAEGFDIALRASQISDSNFISRRLRTVRLKLVASPAYLQHYGIPISPEVLKNHKCIIEGDSDERRRWRFKSKKSTQTSISVNGNFRVNYGGMVKILCTQGIGIAQLPDFFVEDELKSGSLIELMPEYAPDDFYIHLLYHKKSKRNKAIQAVIDYIVGRIKPSSLI